MRATEENPWGKAQSLDGGQEITDDEREKTTLAEGGGGAIWTPSSAHHIRKATMSDAYL